MGLDFEQLLQNLLLNQGLLEDHAPDSNLTPGADAAAGSRPGTTLRAMRRTGPLAELSQQAQTTLLGGTLYEYGNETAPARPQTSPTSSRVPCENLARDASPDASPGAGVESQQSSGSV